MRRTISTLLLLLFVVIAEAQNLTGKVIDSKTQEAIIGATVTLKGSKKIATVTDINGQFRLSNTTEGSIIRISYVGYKSLDVPFHNGATYEMAHPKTCIPHN